MKNLSIVLIIAMFLFSGATEISANEGEILVIEEHGESWFNLNNLNIFESNGAEKLVFPGTKGEYTFTIKNIREEGASFSLDVNENRLLPLSYSMKNEYGWLFGNKSERIKLFPDGQEIKGRVEGNSEETFTIYWEWVFEEGEDIRDTHLGNTDSDIYRLSFKVLAESDDSAPITGDFKNAFMWMMLSFSGLLIVTVLLMKIKLSKGDMYATNTKEYF